MAYKQDPALSHYVSAKKHAASIPVKQGKDDTTFIQDLIDEAIKETTRKHIEVLQKLYVEVKEQMKVIPSELWNHELEVALHETHLIINQQG